MLVPKLLGFPSLSCLRCSLSPSTTDRRAPALHRVPLPPSVGSGLGTQLGEQARTELFSPLPGFSLENLDPEKLSISLTALQLSQDGAEPLVSEVW